MACCPYFCVVFVVSSLIAVRVSPRGGHNARRGIQRIVPRGTGCALERRRGGGWPAGRPPNAGGSGRAVLSARERRLTCPPAGPAGGNGTSTACAFPVRASA